ncbi:coiled-coil domain-containing protein 12 [Nylanderia fulva]|uniref:coiled-coil domain-containing protein 12 n=1 Tax=Nylanderia fulva TaxID=613905 RepID=UPI0010FAD9BF|nr:coiled-coil domain-containing protein 12 [Nylanderia fulva]XP_029161891.1 coiled-coil domain-containing protein 12 [Nylanderia fulva]XP_029161905.1 coiled-coil domain-containing protein 12 [Nylanderia fulva]
MSEEKIGSLEEEALKRKERLQALKRKNEESKENKNNADEILPKPKFRSYKPQDENLKSNMIEDAKPGDVEAVVREQLDAASSKVVIEELDISNLAPRKPDWDLKRDIAKKLEILERRTQKAIAEEVRARLKQGQQNLAVYVNETNKE